LQDHRLDLRRVAHLVAVAAGDPGDLGDLVAVRVRADGDGDDRDRTLRVAELLQLSDEPAP
jgi:hypothetical protein